MKKLLRPVLILSIICQTVLSPAASTVHAADPPPTLSIDTDTRSYKNQTPLAPAPDLTLSGSTNLTGANVVIDEGYHNGEDQLIYSTIHGITGVFDSSQGVLKLTGNAPIPQYQEALRSVKYNNTSSSPSPDNRILTYTLGDARRLKDSNGIYHYYELVQGAPKTWNQSRLEAAGRTYFGMTGYLTSITSQAENDFISAKVTTGGWIGATDALGEGQWIWAAGPETGTQFWQGGANGTPVNGRYAHWYTNEPSNNDTYGNAEHFAYLYGTNSFAAYWNDYSASLTKNEYIVEYGGMAGDPALFISDGVTLVLDNTPPAGISISADTAAPTNNNVTVTVSFPVDAVVREYRVDGGPWTPYTNPVEFTNNGTMEARGSDALGNQSNIVSYAVTNIDKTSPADASFTVNITAPTSSSVTVTVNYPGDGMVREISINDGAWEAYTGPVVFAANGKLDARSTDTAGNTSGVTSYAVTNIDGDAPAGISISADVTTPTNGSVTVTVSFPADAVVREYRLNGGAWTAYTGPQDFVNNGTLEARGADALNNQSAIESYVVTNIDKTAPADAVFSASTAAPTNSSVAVTVNYPVDGIIREISIDGGPWGAYTGPVIFNVNGKLDARSTDNAGNMSGVSSYEVANIDKTAPAGITISKDTVAPTNGNVTLTVNFPVDAAVQEYRIDGGPWLPYTGPVVFSTNGTLEARGADALGNQSAPISYAVTNIDRSAPGDAGFMADITAPTSSSVSVTVSYPVDAAVQEVRVNGGVWEPYTTPVIFAANGTVEARSTDEAGNMSGITSYQVTNIDGDAPAGIIFSADTTSPTNDNVTVAINYPADAVVQEYRVDGGAWTPYTGPVEFTGNGTLEARGADALGNQSTVVSYPVTNIDKASPADASFTADTTAPTSSNVTVTVNYPADGVIREIRINGGAWTAYINPVVFAANGTLDARSTDAAGNISGIASYQVTNIRSSGGGFGGGGAGSSGSTIIGSACRITRVLNRVTIDGCLDEATQTIEARLGSAVLDQPLDELLNSGDKKIIFDVVLPAKIYLIHIPQDLILKYQSKNVQFVFEYVDQVYEMPSDVVSFDKKNSVSTAAAEAIVTYQVNSLSSVMEKELSALASGQGFHIRDLFYQFTVYASSGGNKFISPFQKGKFITRKLYPESRDIEKVTGLAYKTDGSVNYAPYRCSLTENEMELLLLRNAGIYGVVDYAKDFVDSKGHWGQRTMERLASKMIVFGRSEEHFIPDDQVTRAEFAALLLRTLDLPLDSKEQAYFLDVNSSHWYYEVVQSAKDYGIIEGYDDHTFAPEKPVNREEMTAMMVRLITQEFPHLNLGSLQTFSGESSINKFTDFAEISPFFMEQAGLMAHIGLIEGYPDRSFRPKGNAARAESVAIIHRFLEFVEFIR